MRDVGGLYLDPPHNAAVFSFDEKSQIQALDRTQSGLPMKKGRCETMTHDYKRHGTTTLSAGVPPELIIANECLHGEGAPHCQGTTPVFGTIARADSTPERSGDFARANAASERLARHAVPIACRSV